MKTLREIISEELQEIDSIVNSNCSDDFEITKEHCDTVAESIEDDIEDNTRAIIRMYIKTHGEFDLS